MNSEKIPRVAARDDRLPLSPLLSHALVAFTIEFDNAFTTYGSLILSGVCGNSRATFSYRAGGRPHSSRSRRCTLVRRVEIRQSSVSGLPFSDDLFDLVTAVETHYFWPDLPADMREVLRVLKPGGTLIIIAEDYKGGKHDKWLEKVAELTKMVFLTADEHRDLFSNAGYSDVRVMERPDKGWICAIGRKPP